MEIIRSKINNNNGDHKDRLSALDDELLVTILSCLPTKTTVAMSILSHRWRKLWTKLTSLRITQSFDNNSVALAYNLLLRLTTTTIDTFEFVDITPPSSEDILLFRKLMRRVCDLQVKEIHVSFWFYGGDTTYVPNCVFETQSLVVLKLGSLVGFHVPKNGIYLPNLRQLHLWGHDFGYRELMENDLSESFPLLEELHLSGYLPRWFKIRLRISASNLKVLTMKHSGSCDPYYRLPNQTSEVHIDAPNLQHFTIKGGAWLIPYFKNPPIYLSTAYISLGYWWWNKPERNSSLAFEVIAPLYNAKFLDIRGDMYYGITERWLDDSANLPVFDQLTTLKANLVYFSPEYWRSFLGFLKCCPKLEVLLVKLGEVLKDDMEFISMGDYEGTIGHDLLTKVKKITLVLLLQLNKYGFEEICYILKVAKSLKTLNLVAFPDQSFIDRKFQLNEELNFCQKLFKFRQDYSLTCDIKFTGHYLKASSREGINISQLQTPFETLVACANSM